VSDYADWVMVKATRKHHRCVWCGQSIVVGTSCCNQTGIGDDGPFSQHLHHECAYDMECAIKANGGYPVEFGYGDADREEILVRLRP